MIFGKNCLHEIGSSCCNVKGPYDAQGKTAEAVETTEAVRARRLVLEQVAEVVVDDGDCVSLASLDQVPDVLLQLFFSLKLHSVDYILPLLWNWVVNELDNRFIIVHLKLFLHPARYL